MMQKRSDKRNDRCEINQPEKKPKRNAWKKYGVWVMAGVLLAGSVAGSAAVSQAMQVEAEEEEQRITLNIADDEEDEQASEEAAETETETETEAETEEKETYAPIDRVTAGEGAVITTDVSGVVEACMPSIVSITERSVQEIETYYYGTQEYESLGSASGVIVAQNDDELLIATNHHVVDGATELSVGFTAEAENEEDLIVPAKIKGTDSKHELAVVAVKLGDIPEEIRSQLKIATLGKSEELKVGQAAIAIGNALGFGQSVTSGIISALNKEISLDNFEGSLIQTDAAINLGNSGGALLNAKGEVIGINVAKEVGTGAENMGYAIPIDTAIPILEELINRETRDKVENNEHGYLGITVVNVSEDAKELYNMPAGAFVYEVSAGSGAEAAGIHKGDVITKFDGIDISSSDELVSRLDYYKVGETITVEVQTANGGAYESREVEVTLQKGTETADKDNSSKSEEPESDGLPDVYDGYGDMIPYEEEGNGIQNLPFFNGDNGIF